MKNTKAIYCPVKSKKKTILNLDFASRIILTELGIEISETDEITLEMLEKFGESFQRTRIYFPRLPRNPWRYIRN